MKRFTLNVAGVPVEVLYSTQPISKDDMCVEYLQRDTNQTQYNILSNPAGIPVDAARWVFEDTIRKFMSLEAKQKLYIQVEK